MNQNNYIDTFILNFYVYRWKEYLNLIFLIKKKKKELLIIYFYKLIMTEG